MTTDKVVLYVVSRRVVVVLVYWLAKASSGGLWFLDYPCFACYFPIAFKNSSLSGFTLEAKKWVSVPFSSSTYLQKFQVGSWVFQPFCAGSVSH